MLTVTISDSAFNNTAPTREATWCFISAFLTKLNHSVQNGEYDL